MALRGTRIENFLELWWLVASWVVGIWVSSTSFLKSNISWPQQPTTKKVLSYINTIDINENYFYLSKFQNSDVIFRSNQYFLMLWLWVYSPLRPNGIFKLFGWCPLVGSAELWYPFFVLVINGLMQYSASLEDFSSCFIYRCPIFFMNW